jgi:hypothetical protein
MRVDAVADHERPTGLGKGIEKGSGVAKATAADCAG